MQARPREQQVSEMTEKNLPPTRADGSEGSVYSQCEEIPSLSEVKKKLYVYILLVRTSGGALQISFNAGALQLF